ncbi:glycoside hydrolase family 16 protein [Sphingomonas sp.]|uniref:glycoside hydrolase family 16 protein n=1 Tax=Sphingomonas sp. TaxID=28214 RepID=UPI00325FD0E3
MAIKIARHSVAALALMVASLAGWPPSPAEAAGAWTLTWSDEFNGAAGTGVSTTNWIYDVGTGYGCAGCPDKWGTGEIETMSSSTANVYQDGIGNLNIKPIRSGTAGRYTWTSGRIETTRTDFQPAAGGSMAMEARIQLPNVTGTGAQGYWPAFWALGAPYRGVYTNWPSVGEIDVMENINGKNSWWGALHCGVNPGGPCNETTGLTSGEVTGWNPSLQSAFHVYRMEFDKSTVSEEIRWYVDGVQKHVVRAYQVDATTWANATNHGFFILLNVAMGGGWPGSPTAKTVSDKPLIVDYVRVYNR